MDQTMFFGILGGFCAVLLAMFVEGGSPTSFMNLSAFIIIAGGTAAATLAGVPKEQLEHFIPSLRKAFMYKPRDPTAIVATLIRLAEKARREGLLALEDEKEEIEDPFFQKGLQLVVDGIDPTLIRNILETELYFKEEEDKIGIKIWQSAGGYAPTMGIIGTVMGLVHMLEGLGDNQSAAQLGEAVATAFVATFFGIAFANLIFLPIGTKLETRSKEEITLMTAILEGILAIQGGDNPAVVREKLKVFFPKSIKALTEEEGRAV